MFKTTSMYKANGIFDKELEDELMKFTIKHEDTRVQKGHLVNPAEEMQKHIDEEVNITECTKSMCNNMTLSEYHDLTESEGSSSFDESDSSYENDDDTLGNFGALSDLCGDSDGFGDNFRKRNLTAHWRSFIQPIMWRCKWTELKIKRLQSMAQQYDRELEEHDKRKQIQLLDSTLIDGVKSLPLSRSNVESDFVRRKKRRVTEASTDVAAYMSSHNLFSYFESKKNPTEGGAMNNLPQVFGTPKVINTDEFWANYDLSSFLAGDSNNCLEDILRKIEFLQSQAGQLRSRVDKIISENTDNLNLPILPFAKLTANNLGGVGGGTHKTSQIKSEYNKADDDELVLESGVTNRRDGGCSSLNANVDQAHFADAYRNVEDGALIEDRKVKEEMNNIEEVIIDPFQKSSVNTDDTTNQPPSKIQSIAPRSKRKSKRGAHLRKRKSTG